MLIFPEILTKEEVEDLNQIVEEVERFFKENGLSHFTVMGLEDKCRLISQILFCVVLVIEKVKVNVKMVQIFV